MGRRFSDTRRSSAGLTVLAAPRPRRSTSRCRSCRAVSRRVVLCLGESVGACRWRGRPRMHGWETVRAYLTVAQRCCLPWHPPHQQRPSKRHTAFHDLSESPPPGGRSPDLSESPPPGGRSPGGRSPDLSESPPPGGRCRSCRGSTTYAPGSLSLLPWQHNDPGAYAPGPSLPVVTWRCRWPRPSPAPRREHLRGGGAPACCRSGERRARPRPARTRHA